MNKKKYYAVRIGRVPGIYETYEEYIAQIEGFSRPIAKSFKTEEEARKFINTNTYYAVRVGKIPGIYNVLKDALKQTEGFSKADMRKFSSHEDACNYISKPVKNNLKVKKKYYAVKKGKVPGIYESLDNFNEQMRNFSGAEGRVFKTLNDAQDYMCAIDNVSDILKLVSEDVAVAYVDGSFNNEIQACSYGCVIFHMFSKIIMSEKFYDEEMVKVTNVAGELAGALASMQWCVENDIKELHLCYDFSGIRDLCNTNKKLKNSFMEKYKEQYRIYTEDNNLKVFFHKIKSHSGDTHNNEVDRVAKRALVA